MYIKLSDLSHINQVSWYIDCISYIWKLNQTHKFIILSNWFLTLKSYLTHWGWDNMVAILQAIFLIFMYENYSKCVFQFPLKYVPNSQMINKPNSKGIMAVRRRPPPPPPPKKKKKKQKKTGYQPLEHRSLMSVISYRFYTMICVTLKSRHFGGCWRPVQGHSPKFKVHFTGSAQYINS